MEYTTELVVEITPLKDGGFWVSTYNVRMFEGGFKQGQGFKRDRGAITAHQLLHELLTLSTEDITSPYYTPFQVRLK